MSHIVVPTEGQKSFQVKPFPTIPSFLSLRATALGVDITPVMIKVIDAAVAKAYKGEKKISWMGDFCWRKSHTHLWRQCVVAR